MCTSDSMVAQGRTTMITMLGKTSDELQAEHTRRRAGDDSGVQQRGRRQRKTVEAVPAEPWRRVWRHILQVLQHNMQIVG